MAFRRPGRFRSRINRSEAQMETSAYPPQTTKFKSARSSWLQWSWSPDIDPRVAFARAMITIFLLWFTYAAFQFSWQLVNQASNFQGPVYALYPQSSSDPMIARTANWTVTIVRGLVAVGLGLLVTKIGHKNGIIFAMAMIIASFPFILTPQMKDAMIANGTDVQTASEAAYSLFILFRIFMSVGGTAIMIMQAPLIAKFFLKPKTRNAVIKCSNIPANASGILCSMIFINGVVQTALKPTGLEVGHNWQMISGILLGFIGLMLVSYLLVGMHFYTPKASGKAAQLGDADPYRNSFKWMLKQPHILMLLLAATIALYAGIEPGIGLLGSFWQSQPANAAHVWNANGTFNAAESSVSTTMLVWQMLYCAALFLGLAMMGKWSNTKYSQAKFSGIIIVIGCPSGA